MLDPAMNTMVCLLNAYGSNKFTINPYHPPMISERTQRELVAAVERFMKSHKQSINTGIRESSHFASPAPACKVANTSETVRPNDEVIDRKQLETDSVSQGDDEYGGSQN